MAERGTIHASAVLAGPKALLIRGAAGSGKSRLVLSLLQEAARGALSFARLVADDRAYIEARGGRILVRPAKELAGLLEIRGSGIRRLPHEEIAVVGLVVDLGPPADRLPDASEQQTAIEGVSLPRLTIPAGNDPIAPILARLAAFPARI